MTRSIPEGNEGNIPRGRLMPLTFSSQKQRGQSRKRLSALGERRIPFLTAGAAISVFHILSGVHLTDLLGPFGVTGIRGRALPLDGRLLGLGPMRGVHFLTAAIR